MLDIIKFGVFVKNRGVMDTKKTRVEIGFPKKQSYWSAAPATYDEHTLKISGHPVMEDWETGYMKTLATIASSHGGSVLELGYGMGISAGFIQISDIDKHIVVECHPDVIARCINDFRAAIETSRMHLFSGFWQNVTPFFADKSFDGILFDTYPLREEEIHSNHFWFFKEAYRLLKPGGVFTYYSDEVSTFSEKHMNKLLEAGFLKKNIDLDTVSVNPPKECEYWQAKTIMAPIIHKG